ncbi:hypothetical protein BDN71DRAFT_1557247 [Pleurotus eryngii]|uniref:Uncharacterized protein n=1 Tax=Pleurotus eryngii TaxID=5323 RepID=A0A9P5ZXA8_PLEER|nr:hypothetical protein BDN71DRAFT_1557247 [Pleurotus eryngii]
MGLGNPTGVTMGLGSTNTEAESVGGSQHLLSFKRRGVWGMGHSPVLATGVTTECTEASDHLCLVPTLGQTKASTPLLQDSIPLVAGKRKKQYTMVNSPSGVGFPGNGSIESEGFETVGTACPVGIGPSGTSTSISEPSASILMGVQGRTTSRARTERAGRRVRERRKKRKGRERASSASATPTAPSPSPSEAAGNGLL